MIVVTGGAGFIGSNIVKGLNARGCSDILVVDNLTNGYKFKNLVDCNIFDYQEKEDFLNGIFSKNKVSKKITAIFHQGACSATTEWNGHYIIQNNYNYSKKLLHYCLEEKIPFIYASSASVYGHNKIFQEQRQFEQPVNLYGYSKFLFDQYVRQHLATASSQIVGLRYFNVYGPHEQHKGRMASVVFHFNQQLLQNQVVQLFEGTEGYQAGEQRRDFVYVEDVEAVNLWFLDNPTKSGIFNVGTGRSQTFNAVANAVIAWHKQGTIQYIPFPEQLQGCYQSFTEANIQALRQIGYQNTFKTVAEGVKSYLDWLNCHFVTLM